MIVCLSDPSKKIIKGFREGSVKIYDLDSFSMTRPNLKLAKAVI